MAFRVGQKVVCVDASGIAAAFLIKGMVYTVLEIDDPDCISVDCLPANNAPGNRGWFRRRFRPIVERKTDISIFKKMLTPAGRENANV